MSTPRAGAGAPLREYLARLDRASRVLPWTERQDLRAAVWHELARTAGPNATDERLASALERMGPPEDRVPAAVSPRGGTPRDPLVVHLLGCSVLTFGVTGVLGLVRVWRSPTWPARDAVLATLIVVVVTVASVVLLPQHPLLGPLVGGLGAGGLLAALTLGTVLVLNRLALRRLRRSVVSVRPDGL